MSTRPLYSSVAQKFHKEIRRRQLASHFQSQRRFHHMKLTHAITKELSSTLKTTEDKLEWANQIGKVFSGPPSSQWIPLLKKVYSHIPLFEGMTEELFKCGIVASVMQLLSPDNLYLGLSKLAANTLSDVLHLSQGGHAKVFAQGGFLGNLVKLAYETSDIEYTRLLCSVLQNYPSLRAPCEQYNLSLYTRDTIVRLIGRPLPSTFSSENFYILIYLMYTQIRVCNNANASSSMPKTETILCFLQVIEQLLRENLPTYTICLVLRCVKSCVSVPVQNLLPLLPKLVELLGFEARSDVRDQAAEVLGTLLMDQTGQIQSVLLENNILGVILESSELHDNTQRFNRLLLLMVINIIADNPKNQRIVIEHPVFPGFVLKQCEFGSNVHMYLTKQSRKEALYCICSILQETTHLPTLENICSQFQLINLLVSYLRECKGLEQFVSAETVEDILNTFRILLQRYQENNKFQNQYQHNWLYISFKDHYDLPEILGQLIDDEECEICIVKFMEFFDSIES